MFTKILGINSNISTDGDNFRKIDSFSNKIELFQEKKLFYFK